MRAPTDRPSIEYRVEAYEDAAAAERRIEERVRDACATPGPRRRVVLFCRTRADCERMAVRLGCRPYHSRFEDKEEALAAWADGEEQVIVATSALGTGVDVAAVALVLHFGRPHGIVDFVQEVGRAGRACGSPARSIVVLTAGELQWLRSPSSREEEFNREALRLYLTETTCRRQRLAAIMDDGAVGCDKHAGPRRCDLCQQSSPPEERKNCAETLSTLAAGAGLGEGASRARDQAERYASGPQLWRQRVHEQGNQRQRVEEAVRLVGTGCAACWLRGVEVVRHSTYECEWLERALGQRYAGVRARIQFAKGCYCCYRCGLPGDWCKDYAQKQKCQQPDVAIAVVLAAWGTQAGRAWLAGEMQGSGLESVIRWMGQAATVGGARANNAIQAFEQILHKQNLLFI